MSIAITLPADLEKRLESLAKKTRRSKSFFAREAIAAHIDDLEDYYLAAAVRDQPNRVLYTLEEVEKMCGLDSED